MDVSEFRISLVFYASPNTLYTLFLVLHELDYLSILDPNKKVSHGSAFFNLLSSLSLQKKKGRFQHSRFLAGAATSAIGRLIVDNGVLKVM